ncbi:MAG: methenyltetrahydromethanopterin cyclohydrolase, partial [Candidatus Heimdallarchaeota archaeon]
MLSRMEKEVTLNENASIYFNELIENRSILKVKQIKNETGATILDAGINVQGGFEAGKYL